MEPIERYFEGEDVTVVPISPAQEARRKTRRDRTLRERHEAQWTEMVERHKQERKQLGLEETMIDEILSTQEGRLRMAHAEEMNDVLALLELAHEIILDSTPVLKSLEKSWLERKKRFVTGYHKKMGL